MHKRTSTSANTALQHGAGAAQGRRANATREAVAGPLGAAAGRPLDPATRSEMEARFSHDFSQVRVHSDAAAAASARSVNALAYTVGRNVVFGERQLAPSTRAGRRLIAHELAHVVQQSGAGAGLQAKLAVSAPGDMHERQADSAAARVMAGRQVGPILTPAAPAIQRDGPPAAPAAPEKKDAGDVITEGLKVVADQASENNPKLKEKVIEPFKLKLKGVWDGLSTGDKIGAVGVGGAALGIGAGSLLSDPKGRKTLEGVNLAAPFTLIPYMPLSSFTYTLPTGKTPATSPVKFETSFDASDLLNLRTKSRGLPEMKLTATMRWELDPATGKASLKGADASLSLVPGLTISGGAYKDVLRPPGALSAGPGGTGGTSMVSIPGPAAPAPVPEVRVLIQVDLLKFKPADLTRQLRSFF